MKRIVVFMTFSLMCLFMFALRMNFIPGGKIDGCKVSSQIFY